MLVSGKLNEEKLCAFFKSQAKIIKQQSFDMLQARRILNTWESIITTYSTEKIILKNLNLALEAIFEFQLAIEIALSNYRKEKKNFWSFNIFGSGLSKLPSTDFMKILQQRQSQQ